MTSKQLASNSITHIVLFSGGLSSFESARRVIARFGSKNVRLWFFDTQIEDEDLYRFLDESEKNLGVSIERFTEGRNPWQIFHDERFIGNSRADLCSKILKRQYLERLLSKNFPKRSKVKLYFGLDWTETHRMEALKPRWAEKGYQAVFPLSWKPLLTPNDLKEIPRSMGIEIPLLYRLGFTHNNCGGACVKAGIKQWSQLWTLFPDRYRWHEKNELRIRRYLRKDVSILRDRTNGVTKPLTLRKLRLRLQSLATKGCKLPDEILNLNDDSPCSCFVNLDEHFVPNSLHGAIYGKENINSKA
jgi:3'-phosphoadenosine 5'-phosphosulfate sulfotransferase (PAPS reductase)/FAD synthetase